MPSTAVPDAIPAQLGGRAALVPPGVVRARQPLDPVGLRHAARVAHAAPVRRTWMLTISCGPPVTVVRTREAGIWLLKVSGYGTTRL